MRVVRDIGSATQTVYNSRRAGPAHRRRDPSTLTHLGDRTMRSLWSAVLATGALCLAFAGPAQAQDEVQLYNGKDLKGWTYHLNDPKVKMEDVWSIHDGILVCKGRPAGYIRTEKDYTNYVLTVEWMWPAEKKPGNSGVLVRMVGQDKVWPKSIEAQLQSGNAGDFWNIDNFVMTVDPARTNGRNTRKLKGNEKALGEWNTYEITCNKGHVILKVNGEVLNEATNCEEVAGKICLQSEGAEIHFRRVSLKPLP